MSYHVHSNSRLEVPVNEYRLQWFGHMYTTVLVLSYHLNRLGAHLSQIAFLDNFKLIQGHHMASRFCF